MSLWFKELPPGWEEAPLKYRLARNDGGVWGEDPDGGDSDSIVLRSTEQRADGAWNIEAPAIRKISTAEAEGGRLEVGDLVVTKSSGSELHIGKTSLVTTEVAALNACYSNFMQRLRVDGRTEPRFVHYWMNNELCREQFAYLSNSTSGLANLNGTVLGTALLAFPRKDEQERIANFLDEQTARIDALIAEKETLQERLSEYRRSLVSSAVTQGVPGRHNDLLKHDFLGFVPRGWGVGKFRHYVQARSGQVDPEDPKYADLVLVAPNHIESSTGRLLSTESARDQAAESGKYWCDAGDVIYSKIRPALRKATLAPFDCLCSADMYPLKGVGPLSNKFLFWYLLSEPFSDFAVQESMRVAMPKLNRETLADAAVPLPSEAEQAEIITYLESTTTSIDNVASHVIEHIARLREYRSSLISAAVTGQLSV